MYDVGSIALGVWIARIALAVLVVQAWIEGKPRVAMVAVALGLAGWLVLGRINPALVTPCLAVLDIALVLVVFGRDIRLN
jgi:hypothetical protein